MALLIDTSSAARQLSESELGQWAQGRGAFISSVMDELAVERRALANSLNELGIRVILFEDLGGREDSAEQAYLAGVAQAEIYLGLVGDRYGSMLPGGRSATHEEYLKAQELGRRISVWAKEPSSERQGNARDFLAEVQIFHTTGRFSTSDDLVARVQHRLAEIAADDESPWAKLGDAIFRVDRIRDEGNRVLLTASIREPAVARYLEDLRPDGWGRSEELLLSTSDRSGPAKVASITSETRSTSRRQMEIAVDVNWADGRGNSMAAGTSNYTADELSEIGLKAGLLGASPPPEFRDMLMASLVNQTDPLEGLLHQTLPEDSFEAVARLLIAEQLIGSGRASYIESFQIGPRHQGRRPLKLVYRDPQRYSNQEPAIRTIEGSRSWE
ncbi:MAG TPA: DUF4062 domain-containing protein [Solirubrobacterales bacterium]|nr:DUF4062 domain-containing protein [Solirubrobacterales bacterium]